MLYSRASVNGEPNSHRTDLLSHRQPPSASPCYAFWARETHQKLASRGRLISDSSRRLISDHSWVRLDTRKAILWEWGCNSQQLSHTSLSDRQDLINCSALKRLSIRIPSISLNFIANVPFLNLLSNLISMTKEIESRIREEAPINPPIHHHYHHDAVRRQRYT